MKLKAIISFLFLCIICIQATSVAQEASDPDVELALLVNKGAIQEIQEGLASKKFNPNASISDKKTILFLALYKGNNEITKLLLQHGANPNYQDKRGWTVLHYTLLKKKYETALLLLEHGANPEIQSNGGQTPLMFAGMVCVSKFIQKVLQNEKIDINLASKSSKSTVLHHASICPSYKTRYKMIKDLVKAGADVNQKDATGKTILHYMARKQGVDPIKFLLKHGANPNIVDRGGNIPFYYAQLNRKYDNGLYLLKKGSDLNHINRKKETIRELALQTKDKKIVNFVRSQSHTKQPSYLPETQ